MAAKDKVMEEKTKRIYKVILRKALVLLGFGTTFVFMACYGPAPTHGGMVDVPEEFMVEDDSCLSNEEPGLQNDTANVDETDASDTTQETGA